MGALLRLSNRRVKAKTADQLVPGVAETLTAADVRLLRRAIAKAIDVEDANGADVLWLLHFKLVETVLDPGQRLWLRTTGVGVLAAKEACKWGL